MTTAAVQETKGSYTWALAQASKGHWLRRNSSHLPFELGFLKDILTNRWGAECRDAVVRIEDIKATDWEVVA